MQTVRTGSALTCNCNCCSFSNLLQSSSTFASIQPPLTSASSNKLTFNSQHEHGRRSPKEKFELPLEKRVQLLSELNPQYKKSRREIPNSSIFVPTTSGSGINLDLISSLIDSYAQLGQFHEILPIIDDITSRHPTESDEISRSIYFLAVSCFGTAGRLELMEEALNRMASKGLKIDSLTGNAFVKYYSLHGSILEMEYVYRRLKKSRISIESGTIRAMASAYIRAKKHFKLGEFVKDVGLRRLNTGNLLWNLLLLSYAVDFKMKSLQREFLAMLDNGFKPDLTTFNIRALAFSRMCMFWDLHLSLDHMKNEGVIPDLVTYGCFVDAYMERRLGRNLSFALEKMGTGRVPVVRTDPLVFEAFGKGDFHASSEALLETARQRRRTYAQLVGVYLKKRYRSNQVFWNY